MNSAVVDYQFAVYELLKDAIKITRRSVRRGNYDLHGRTSLVGEAPVTTHDNRAMDRQRHNRRFITSGG